MAVSIGFALCLDYWINWIAFIPEVVTFQVFFQTGCIINPLELDLNPRCMINPLEMDLNPGCTINPLELD